MKQKHHNLLVAKQKGSRRGGYFENKNVVFQFQLLPNIRCQLLEEFKITTKQCNHSVIPQFIIKARRQKHIYTKPIRDILTDHAAWKKSAFEINQWAYFQSLQAKWRTFSEIYTLNRMYSVGEIVLVIKMKYKYRKCWGGNNYWSIAIPWPKRLSNTDSSTILEPLHVVSSAIVGGWRSVGKPGNGLVLTLKPRKFSQTFSGIAETWNANHL